MVCIRGVDCASRTTRAGCPRASGISREGARSRGGEAGRRCKMLLPAIAVLPMACSQYAAVPVTTPPPAGHRVRMELTPAGVARLSETLGNDIPHFDRGIEGELLRTNADQYLVAVRVWSTGAGEANQLEQTVAVPMRDVVSL